MASGCDGGAAPPARGTAGPGSDPMPDKARFPAALMKASPPEAIRRPDPLPDAEPDGLTDRVIRTDPITLQARAGFRSDEGAVRHSAALAWTAGLFGCAVQLAGGRS